MITQIKKRDGNIALFNKGKINDAIFKAAKSVGGKNRERADLLGSMVIELLEQRGFCEKKTPTVEDVQDAVEKILIEEGHAQTAKAYIIYREQHKRIREFHSYVNSNEIMDGYLNQLDWRVKENSNMSFSLQGLNNHISSIVSSNYWLHKIYPPEVRGAHIEGDLHLHDLQILGSYCCGWDIMDLMLKGFGGVPEKVESMPARHYRAMLGQITNFFYTLQGETAGAQAFSNFNTMLAPFVKYDHLEYKDVKQGMQEFLFNMNVPTRVGFQTPFTNLTLDIEVPENLRNSHAIIGGRPMPETYGDFQKEAEMVNRAFLEVMAEGDAKGRIFTFPIPTYNVTKNIDWKNPAHDTLFEVTSKFGLPYFANFVNSEMSPDDARSMCCRLRLDNRELRKRSGGLFASAPLTGSIGVVTLNMPRIAFAAKDEARFAERVVELMKISKTSLDIKRKAVERFTEQGLYPYARRYLSGVKKATGQYWGNHFNTIGLIGMNEACLNILGNDIASNSGKKFALGVLDVMREELRQYQESTNDNYNLEATPGEGCSYRFAKMDRERSPTIKTAGDKVPYYTNSTHLPVGHTDDIFEALDLQDELQCKYTGGTVLHGFVGERISDPETCKKLVKKIAYNYKLPYFTITPTFSVCPEHGYIAGERQNCEKETAKGVCGRKCEIFSRVVGYYRPVQSWNDGKREEFRERKPYCEKKSLASMGKKQGFRFAM